VIPLSGRVPGRASDLASTMMAACSRFCGKSIGGLGFSHRGEYIGRRAALGGGPGGLIPWWHSQGLGRATLRCGRPVAPLRLIFGFREASVKIGGSVLFHPIPRIFPV
jgi:hypothetical protein